MAMAETRDDRRAGATGIQSADTSRQKLLPRKRRSKPTSPSDPATRRSDRLLVGGLVAAVAVSMLPALAPSPFSSEAPIQIADATAPAPALVETAELPDPVEVIAPAVDPVATASLGEPRGATQAPVGSPQVIEVPKEALPLGSIRISDPTDMRQPREVAHLPEPALLDDDGAPRIANGRRPLDVYAGQWSGRRGNRIAVIVGGLGVSQSGTMEAIERLPGGVTLALSPDGNSLERWTRAARLGGHELLLQVPMQAFGRGEPDPRERRLELDLGADENNARLRRSLERITNYVGVMNYRGGAFQADQEVLTPVMREVRDRGLLYVDDGSNAQSRAGAIARSLAAPFAGADRVLDLDRDPEAIKDALLKLEETARGTGRAIAVATAYPETVEAIAEWARAVGARGFELVPVSALADDPSRR